MSKQKDKENLESEKRIRYLEGIVLFTIISYLFFNYPFKWLLSKSGVQGDFIQVAWGVGVLFGSLLFGSFVGISIYFLYKIISKSVTDFFNFLKGPILKFLIWYLIISFIVILILVLGINYHDGTLIFWKNMIILIGAIITIFAGVKKLRKK